MYVLLMVLGSSAGILKSTAVAHTYKATPTPEVVEDISDTLVRANEINNLLHRVYREYQSTRPSSDTGSQAIRTEYDTDEREDDELGDDQEREVTRDNSAIHARVGVCAHILGQFAHDDRKCPAEQGRDRRRKHTRDECEGTRGGVGPLLQEGNKCSQLGYK